MSREDARYNSRYEEAGQGHHARCPGCWLPQAYVPEALLPLLEPERSLTQRQHGDEGGRRDTRPTKGGGWTRDRKGERETVLALDGRRP